MNIHDKMICECERDGKNSKTESVRVAYLTCALRLKAAKEETSKLLLAAKLAVRTGSVIEDFTGLRAAIKSAEGR